MFARLSIVVEGASINLSQDRKELLGQLVGLLFGSEFVDILIFEIRTCWSFVFSTCWSSIFVTQFQDHGWFWASTCSSGAVSLPFLKFPSAELRSSSWHRRCGRRRSMKKCVDVQDQGWARSYFYALSNREQEFGWHLRISRAQAKLEGFVTLLSLSLGFLRFTSGYDATQCDGDSKPRRM